MWNISSLCSFSEIPLSTPPGLSSPFFGTWLTTFLSPTSSLGFLASAWTLKWNYFKNLVLSLVTWHSPRWGHILSWLKLLYLINDQNVSWSLATLLFSRQLLATLVISTGSAYQFVKSMFPSSELRSFSVHCFEFSFKWAGWCWGKSRLQKWVDLEPNHAIIFKLGTPLLILYIAVKIQ